MILPSSFASDISSDERILCSSRRSSFASDISSDEVTLEVQTHGQTENAVDNQNIFDIGTSLDGTTSSTVSTYFDNTCDVSSYFSNTCDGSRNDDYSTAPSDISTEEKVEAGSAAHGKEEEDEQEPEEECSLQVAERLQKKSQELLKMASEALLDSPAKCASLSRNRSTTRLHGFANRRPQSDCQGHKEGPACAHGCTYCLHIRRASLSQDANVQGIQDGAVRKAVCKIERSLSNKSVKKYEPLVLPSRRSGNDSSKGGRRGNSAQERPQNGPGLESQVERLEERSKDLMRLLSEALETDNKTLMVSNQAVGKQNSISDFL
jgi:hypothetical protein